MQPNNSKICRVHVEHYTECMENKNVKTRFIFILFDPSDDKEQTCFTEADKVSVYFAQS